MHFFFLPQNLTLSHSHPHPIGELEELLRALELEDNLVLLEAETCDSRRRATRRLAVVHDGSRQPDNLVHLEAASPNSHEHKVHDEHNPRLGVGMDQIHQMPIQAHPQVANASEKRRKLNSIHEEGTEGVEVESNSSQSGIQRKGMLAFKGRGKAKFGYNDEDDQPQAEGHGDNVELVGDVGGSSNDPVVDAFDLDNLIFLEPNDDDKQSEEDLDDDGDGDESDDIHGDDPIRGLDMLL
ncbi:hypothetical protein JHK87_012001 [Glycine soja]|nr:hypothetical protein JHK87_012001 [Glycine soja]